MAVVYMTYPVHTGKELAFEEASSKIIDVMGNAVGHKTTHLYRRVSGTWVFLIASEWESKSAFETFVNSEEFKVNTASWGKDKIVSGQPNHHFIET